MPLTRVEVDIDTITFIPHTIPVPEMKMENFLRQVAADIITLLTHPPPGSAPTLTLGNTTHNGLLQLATLLHTNEVTDTLIQQQHRKTLNEAQRVTKIIAPVLVLPPHAVDTSTTNAEILKQQTLLKDIKQLTRVLNEQRLARVCHVHTQARRRFHPTDYWQQ